MDNRRGNTASLRRHRVNEVPPTGHCTVMNTVYRPSESSPNNQHCQDKKKTTSNLEYKLVFAGHDPRLNVFELVSEVTSAHRVIPATPQLLVQLP